MKFHILIFKYRKGKGQSVTTLAQIKIGQCFVKTQNIDFHSYEHTHFAKFPQ